MSVDLNAIAERVMIDFAYFCKVCLDIKALDYHLSPNHPNNSYMQTKPFKLAKHQRKFIEYLNQPYPDKVILKCRQRGYTQVLLAWVLWRMLYHPNQNILYVLQGDDFAKEAMEKTRFMYDSMEEIFKPEGMQFTAKGLVRNRRLGNKLDFRTATDKLGRSETYSMTICDEFSYYDLSVQRAIAGAIVSSCPSNRIWLSTPKREDDIYHDKVREAESANTLWVDSFWDHAADWYGSQDNAKLWRANEEKSRTQAQVNKELDCKFRGAAEDLIWFVPPAAYKPARKGAAQGKVIVSIDLGFNPDPSAVLIAKDYGHALHIIDELVVTKQTITSLALLIKSKGYSIRYGVMDSQGKKVDLTSGFSPHQEAQRLLRCKFYTKKPQKEEGAHQGNVAFQQSRVYVDPDKCPQLRAMLENYETEGGKIPHNHYSHLHDALVYLIYNWGKLPRRTQGFTSVPRSSVHVRL